MADVTTKPVETQPAEPPAEETVKEADEFIEDNYKTGLY